ncbi:MAG: MarR family transcriptional regulator [Chloroflexi bacterium]|nr:MAG: MarR family transcriptional regulator [Chloroflexota bacterium]
MQVSDPDIAARFDRLVAEADLSRRGLQAWDALLRAHATLMRRLETDLELADRALISRSGMTRRVARLVREGLVRRANTEADARGVVVMLTDAGQDRLTETAPVHMRGVSDLFVAKLDDHELAVLESALAKVTLDCTFG